MDSKTLNKRKQEIVAQQSEMLQKSITNKLKFTPAEDETYKTLDAEAAELEVSLSRIENLNKRSAEIGTVRETPAVGENTAAKKFYAFAGQKSTTPLEVNEDQVKSFYAALRTPADFQRYMIQNASLGEGGTSAAGGALVPIETDPSIPNLKIEECSARSLSTVITTTMDRNIPYQATKSVAALKTESTSSGTNAFATNSPTFGTTKLSAYLIGDSVYASWELLEDAQMAAQFIPADIMRAIVAKEENYFINGTGSGQPQGYLGNGTTAVGADVTAGAATLAINPILDQVSTLNKAYYANAKFLVNRQEFNRLLKKQIATSQYQTFVTWDANGSARLLGYEVAFSAEMPVYNASPAVQGAWLFGDFATFAVIGDRGDSNIRVKVLDQVAALNGQSVILGYRRADQRVRIAEAVVQLNTSA